MLWAICGFAQLVLLGCDGVTQSRVQLPVAQMLAGLLIRPHYAMVWLFAASVGVIVRRKAFESVPILLLGVGVAYWALATMVPQTVEMVQKVGAGEGLEQLYEVQRDACLRHDERGLAGGGSTIVYASGGPVPVLSGLAIVFLRPYPTEVQDVESALAGAEVWGLSLILALAWLNCRQRVRLLWTSLGICGVITILLMGFLFSYCYNLGLAARQRLQVYPAILAMIALPVLSRQQPVKAADRDDSQGPEGAFGGARRRPTNVRAPHAVGLAQKRPSRRASASTVTKTPSAGGDSQARPPTKPIPVRRRAIEVDKLAIPDRSETT
ncbi:MAG: hypothetical protein JW809_01660 [Pirellulales bacterium]|nr:hypothetical protein [Pirellulales bacterium]